VEVNTELIEEKISLILECLKGLTHKEAEQILLGLLSKIKEKAVIK
jgi:hypothetical protein